MHREPASDASAAPVGGEAPRLSEQLRAATADAHAEAERTPFVLDLLAGRLAVVDYVRLLAQHRAMYGVLEDVLASVDDPVLAPFLVPELSRGAAIEEDLRFLAGAEWSALPVLASTEAYCARLRELGDEWPGGLLAHHYVRYMGDLSGGQIIGRILRRSLDLPDGRGTAFHRFDRIPDPSAFKARYRSLLDELPWAADDRRRLIDEAIAAFRANTDILLEL